MCSHGPVVLTTFYYARFWSCSNNASFYVNVWQCSIPKPLSNDSWECHAGMEGSHPPDDIGELQLLFPNNLLRLSIYSPWQWWSCLILESCPSPSTSVGECQCQQFCWGYLYHWTVADDTWCWCGTAHGCIEPGPAWHFLRGIFITIIMPASSHKPGSIFPPSFVYRVGKFWRSQVLYRVPAMYVRILSGWGVHDLFRFPLVLVAWVRGPDAAAPLGWTALCMMIPFVQWVVPWPLRVSSLMSVLS